MFDHLDDLGRSASTDLAIKSLNQVQSASDQFPSPSLVAETVVPERSACKWRYRLHSVSDKAASGMSIKSQEEWYKQMMRVPKRLERLLSNLLMRGRVHEHHAEKHHMASDASGLLVMDLDSCLGAHLRSLDIEETISTSARYQGSWMASEFT